MDAIVLGNFLALAYVFIIFALAVIPTFYRYVNKRFLNEEVYFWHGYFWWFIAFFPILLMLIRLVTGLDVHMPHENGLDYNNEVSYAREAFWQFTAIWVLFVSTASLGPAIYQNRSEIGMDGILLFMADCCGLVYLWLHFTQPNISASTLFAAAAAFTVAVFIVTIAVSSIAQVKRIAKTMLFIFSILLTLAVPLMLIKGLYGLLKYGILF
jgi:hypothetical protein